MPTYKKKKTIGKYSKLGDNKLIFRGKNRLLLELSEEQKRKRM